MLSLLMEAIGILFAASTVRMVAGTSAAIVALAALVLNRLVVAPAPFLFPAALLLSALLRLGGARHLLRDAIVVCACLSLCCVWHWPAWLLVPVTACAFAFQILLPDSGNRPWRELSKSGRRTLSSSSIAIACVVTVPIGVAVFGLGHPTQISVPSSFLDLAVSLIAALWLLSGLREVNGPVVAIAGLPVSCLLFDPLAARPLLLCATISLGALCLRSLRLKLA